MRWVNIKHIPVLYDGEKNTLLREVAYNMKLKNEYFSGDNSAVLVVVVLYVNI